MSEADNDYAKKLSEKLKEFSAGLDDDRQRELLAGILTVAHGLKSNGNGNGPSSLVGKFPNAFDPLPVENIRTILKYKNEDPPAGMIVYGEPVVAHEQPDLEQPPS